MVHQVVQLTVLCNGVFQFMDPGAPLIQSEGQPTTICMVHLKYLQIMTGEEDYTEESSLTQPMLQDAESQEAEDAAAQVTTFKIR